MKRSIPCLSPSTTADDDDDDVLRSMHTHTHTLTSSNVPSSVNLFMSHNGFLCHDSFELLSHLFFLSIPIQMLSYTCLSIFLLHCFSMCTHVCVYVCMIMSIRRWLCVLKYTYGMKWKWSQSDWATICWQNGELELLFFRGNDECKTCDKTKLNSRLIRLWRKELDSRLTLNMMWRTVLCLSLRLAVCLKFFF